MDVAFGVNEFYSLDLCWKGLKRCKIKENKKTFLTSWSTSIRTVLRLNFLLQRLNKSSRLGPKRSITITLQFAS